MDTFRTRAMTWRLFFAQLLVMVGAASCWHGARTSSYRPIETISPPPAPSPAPPTSRGEVTPPAIWYGSLDRGRCHEELYRRGVAFHEVTTKTPGVLAPIRLQGPVNGVVYRTELAPAKRATVPWEVFDCRLVLALFDFSAILRSHGIAEALMFSAWRPPGKNWPDGQQAKRHPGALAIDIKRFRRWDGSVIDIKRDFHGRIGHTTCGDDADPPRQATEASYTLRAIVCQAASWKIFNSVLTPNYDEPHQDHLHLDITAGAKWFLVR